MSMVLVRVAGITFNNEDGSSRQEILSRMSKGRKLRFRDAATKEFPNAISVHNVKGEQLGFLPADAAEYIRRRLITPADLQGEVFSIGLNKNNSAFGCLIFIEHPCIEANAVNFQTESPTKNHPQAARIQKQNAKSDPYERQLQKYREAAYNQRSSEKYSGPKAIAIGCLVWPVFAVIFLFLFFSIFK